MGVKAARSFLIKLPAIENALSLFADDMGIPSKALAILPSLGKSFSLVFQNSKIDSTLHDTLLNRFISSTNVVLDLNEDTCFPKRDATSDVDGCDDVDKIDAVVCISLPFSTLFFKSRMVFSMTSSLDVSKKTQP